MSMPNNIPPNDEAGLRMWLELLRGEVVRLEAKVVVLENRIKVLEDSQGGA